CFKNEQGRVLRGSVLDGNYCVSWVNFRRQSTLVWSDRGLRAHCAPSAWGVAKFVEMDGAQLHHLAALDHELRAIVGGAERSATSV
ncbi:hypothetical protein, partial [Variovorax boronicumulans]|uniref:hypothetical protein n=1 Tax=Variovorax boronicumulans TaxID=436515 RepID=UPI0027D8128F